MLTAEQKLTIIEGLGYNNHIDAFTCTLDFNNIAGNQGTETIDWHPVSSYLDQLARLGILSQDDSKRRRDGFVVYKLGK